MRNPRVVSLYSGAGGLDLGFVAAGFKPVFANDIDAHASATYLSWMDNAARELPHLESAEHRYEVGDICDVKDLPGEGDAELVIGGPPCQGFSVAGKMDPNDPRSRHVWNFLGMVDRVKPRAFVMENVKALAVNERWSDLRESLIRSARKMGYATSLLLLNASHYGVPQARERMFLVGIKGLATAYRGPSPSTFSSPPTVASALKSLPRWGEEGNDSLCTAKVTPAKMPVLRKSEYAGMLFNGQGRPMNLLAPAPTLPASMGGNRTPVIDQVQLESGGPSWITGYHADLMAGQPPLNEIPERMRRITVQEAAALQSFPPEMEWSGSQSVQYRQIGNAVPPLLAFHVAVSLRSNLDFEEFQYPSELMGLRIPAIKDPTLALV